MPMPISMGRGGGASLVPTLAHAIVLPGGVVPGEMLAVLFQADDNTQVNVDAVLSGPDWSLIQLGLQGGRRFVYAWKIATGLDALALTTSQAVTSWHTSMRWLHALALRQAPANFTPRGNDTMWITNLGHATVSALVEAD